MRNYSYVYILGIGGYAMSALARYFKQTGAVVWGYDRSSSSMTDKLIKEGIQIHFEAVPQAIPQIIIDYPANTLVIYSSAIGEDHPILSYLKTHQYAAFKRTAVFDQLTAQYFTWAIAGTHGKTTTTSLAAHIVYAAGKHMAAFLGGISKNYGSNFFLQEIPHQDKNIVIEADEYDRFFLSLHPDIAIVTTVNPDHLDTYQDVAGFKQGFNDFLDLLPADGLAILHQNVFEQLQPNPKNNPAVACYALHHAPIHAANIQIEKGIFYFDYISEQTVIPRIALPIPGYHNIENALAVITACLFAGIEPDIIKQAISTFQGVVRRFDRIIEREDLVFLDDYAHHPVEIAALLKAVRQVYPNKKVAIVFRPNLYTRTRDLATEFADSLDLADCVFLMDLYPDREKPMSGISSQTIFDQLTIGNKYLCTQDSLLDCLTAYGKPDVILNVGSGGTSQLIPLIKDFLLENWGPCNMTT